MKKSFLASNWFVQNQVDVSSDSNRIIRDRSHLNPKQSSILAPFIDQNSQPIKIENELNRFFVPGWKGDSLISRNIKILTESINQFHEDVKQHFQNIDKFSRKQKISIFEELINFANYKNIQLGNIDNYTEFILELKKEDSLYKKQLEQFINILSFRIAVTYLFKIRFIMTLIEETNEEFNIKSILYPNSYLTSAFKSASSLELKARSFEQNIFNWYRPSEKMKPALLNFKEVATKLSITELIKTTSIKSEELLNIKPYYSHSISHKQYGLFLNSLLINFPIWLNTLGQGQYRPFTIPNSQLEVISCKYDGDYLESIGLSHWLAQDHNKNIKWDQILCPDFKNDDFENGTYLKTLNELQFLTFLAEIAKNQNQTPKMFITNVVNNHLYNRKNSNEVQKSLIFNDNALNTSTYDRIILNLIDFPKNNPQHYLFTKISNQKKYLKSNGYIFVITSKKIFVPSQKQKVDLLLKDFKVEGVMNLNQIEGKGEIGSYLYIFSNKDEFDVVKSKQSCLNFRYMSQLKTFHEFETITELTHKFFNENLGDLPAISQVHKGMTRLEFYQDAIVGGQLINSTNKDANNITHPSFFKKLINLCHPFDYFFELDSINFKDNDFETNKDFFNYSSDIEKDLSQYIIIVDQRQKNKVQIEFIKSSMLESKSYEYGHTLCSYFYAKNKWPNMDIKAIADFFKSSIGNQIVNLTFHNEIRKVKGNLTKLLIPKFFINNKPLPSHINDGFKLLNLNKENLLNLHPSELSKEYSNLECFLPGVVHDYPATVFSSLTQFKNTLSQSLDSIKIDNKSDSINFNNPILKSPLVLSKTYPIYPNNDDVYIEFSIDANTNIHQGLTDIKYKQLDIHGKQSNGLALYSNDAHVLTIYSDLEMLHFLNYLLSQVLDLPISKILQCVSVPKLQDLKSIISSFNSMTRVLSETISKVSKTQDRLLNSTIFAGK